MAPLPLPEPGRLPAVAELAGVPAVALFVERAQAANARFALTAENAAAIAGICRRLDGLPLAIELAAARIKVLPPAALLARLEQRLPLLTGGGRDLPTRQRTMRDAIAWSYDLLTPEEQKLFRRLAIIAGGFTLAAAEAVAAPEGDLPVFDGIAALIEQSLLRQAPGSDHEPRFVMLEIVREFGLEMLAAANETEASRERHAHYFLGPDDVPTPFAPIFGTPESAALLAAERDNVRLALMWLDERDNLDALLERTLLLYRLWFAPGLHREGQQWIERALERTSDAAPRMRFQALDAAMTLAVAWRRLRPCRHLRSRTSGACTRIGRPSSDGRSSWLVRGTWRIGRANIGERKSSCSRPTDSFVSTLTKTRIRSHCSFLETPPWLRSSSTGPRSGMRRRSKNPSRPATPGS